MLAPRDGAFEFDQTDSEHTVTDEHGAPYFEVPAKRVADDVPIQFDWHDYLANDWQPGRNYPIGERLRPIRALATGFEYEVTTAGQSGNRRPVFPQLLNSTVRSGSVVFTARELSDASLRATIASAAFPTVDGLTLSNPSDEDLVYTTYVAAGVNRQRYEVKHQITLSNAPGEIKEAVALLAVLD